MKSVYGINDNLKILASIESTFTSVTGNNGFITTSAFNTPLTSTNVILDTLNKWNQLGQYNKKISQVLTSLRDTPIDISGVEKLHNMIRDIFGMDKEKMAHLIPTGNYVSLQDFRTNFVGSENTLSGFVTGKKFS